MLISVRRTLLALGIAALIALPLRAGSYRWTTAGPEPGFIFQIVVNPQDSNTLYTYAGYFGPLFYRTENRGQAWVEIEGLLFPTRLVADPSSGSRLYAIGYSGVVAGVFKSDDAGRSWSAANAGITSPVSMIAVAPSVPTTLYAIAPGSPGRVFRSNDGAASWLTVSNVFFSTYVGDLAIDPSNPAILYSLASPGLLKSVDGGATWAPAGALPYPTCIRIDPTAPSTLYAGTNANGVYKSADGGLTWNPSSAGIGDQWVRDLALDPTDPQRIFAAGGGGLFVTSNGGQSWSPVDLGAPVNLATAVAIDPRNPSLVYAAASESVLRGGFFQSSDGGSSWSVAEKGLSGYYSYAVAPHPATPARAYAVSGAKVFRTDAGGADWSLRGAAPHALTSLVADPFDGEVLFGAFVTPEPGGDGVLKSIDGGASWIPATGGLSVSQINRLAIAPSESDRLLAATFDGLFGTSNGGGLWALRLSGDIRAAAIDPADPTILYAGLFAGAGQDGLLRSDDDGVSWSAPAGLPTSFLKVSAIAVPSGDPASVYVAAGSSGVYRSLDRGMTFAPAEAGLPDASQVPFRLAPDPSDVKTLYVVTVPGVAAAPSGGGAFANVFRTTDGADSWTPLPAFIPSLTTLGFGVDVSGRTLYASTISGVFQFERSFLDVPEGDLFWTSVDAAAMNGVTAGCGAGRFCPGAPTSRASVAVFLLRGKNGGAYLPPAATGTVFGDVAAASPAADFIEELFRQGISAGCGGGNYCPGAAVTRAAMAILVLKTKHGSAYTPPSATGTVFSDVPAGAFAADWIEQLYAEGITAGCGFGNFCPNDSLSRAQAAALVVRAFGLS